MKLLRLMTITIVNYRYYNRCQEQGAEFNTWILKIQTFLSSQTQMPAG